MTDEKAFLSRILEVIRASPLRLTRKRESLLETLVSLDRPVSAADLRDLTGLPEGDLVTVYRTLEAFEGIGIVQRIPLEDGSNLYEATAPNEHFHHLLCRQCHKTQRIEFCLGEELETLASRLGFTRVNHVLEVYGLCPDCTGQASQAG